MNRNVQRWKNWIRWALAVVVTLDSVLVVVNWRLAAAPQAQPQQELSRLKVRRDLLKADVSRGLKLRQELAGAQRECDQFFAKELRPVSTGYSSIIADLGAIAKDAGLRTNNVNFRQRDITNRGVVEVEVTATVEGAYPSLVSFINGLERSDNFYLLDSLSLASSSGGSLKLNLQLRTYFRS